MTSSTDIIPKNKQNKTASYLLMLAGLMLFLLSLDLMGQSFKMLSEDSIDSIIKVAANPFIGLFIGLLITAIIQSSSTSTAIMITAVASGSITFQDVVPMILGANIGTTLTSTLICIGYIDKKKEFRKALAAGVIHDFFNIIVVMILFPLELNYNLLSNLTQELAQFLSISESDGMSQVYNYHLFDFKISNGLISIFGGVISLLLSFVGLFVAIKIVSRQIYSTLIGDPTDKLRLYLFKSPLKAFSAGALSTGLIQSSSITTSLIVPLVATGKVKIKRIAPFIYGANVGTTITAFITVAFNSATVINIAILHLLINVFGVLLFMPFKFTREFPVYLAKKFARFINRYRIGIVIYILFVFFLIPFVLINLY